MKPRYLEIEGLNSFIEKQKIDFSILTEKGLFGIFGPTGSGKSSILDGIILALYGKISRDSTGYINTQSEKVEVKYEFEIRQLKNRKIYRAERVIKRDKKGGYKTSIARLIEKNNEKGDIPLAEGPTEVKKKIQEIVGLSLDDFTRSVVLPQGKFSEFLKLSGKERSNMLERIFRLEKYGKNLTIKIRTAKKQNSGKLDILTGEMKKYEGISKEIFDSLKEELEALKKEEEKIKKEKNKIEDEYEKYKNIWDLQLELKDVYERYESLKKEEGEYKIKSEKLNKGKRALSVKPYIDSFKETVKKIECSEKKFIELQKKLKELEENLDKTQREYAEALKNKEEKIPCLIEKETNLKRAIQLSKQEEILKEERKKLVDEYKNIDAEYKNIKNNLEKLQNKRKLDENKLKELNEKLQVLNIDPEYRNIINREINEYHKSLELNKKQEENEKKSKNFEEKIRYIKSKIKEILGILSCKSEEFKKNIFESEKLEKNNPGDSTALLKLQNEINILNEKYIKVEEGTKELIGLNVKIEEKNTRIREIEKKIEPLEKLLKNKEKEREELKEKIEKIREDNMANILASKLKEGDICPVCGAQHHPKVAKKVESVSILDKKDLLEKLEEDIKVKRNEYEKLNIGLAQLNSENKYYKEEKEKIMITLKGVEKEKLKNDLEKKKVDFINLKEEKEKFDFYKKELDDKIYRLREEKSKEEKELAKNEQILQNYENNFRELKKESSKLESEIKEIFDNQTKIKEKFNINNIEEEYEKISKSDKEKIEVENSVKDIRTSIEEADKGKENFKNKESSLITNMAKVVQSGKEKKSELDRISLNIKELSYGKEPEKYIIEVREQVEEITKQELSLRTSLEKVRSEKEKIEREKTSEEKNKFNLYSTKEKEEERLKTVLIENEFSSYDEAEKNLIDKTLIEIIEKDINSYNENVTVTRNEIILVKNKLKGESIEKEKWENLKKYRVDIEKILEEKVRREVEKSSELTKVAELLKEQSVKEKERLKLEHKASLLEELDKLIMGNKLVDFVAMSQLKYIALDASIRLKNITRGRYALEISEDGEFIIRDDFNGGIRRTTSTLSGGETFLASLSLALALSSQIQLKGKAPLEFFFLDEGFGTLDYELLDTVITSLEKLHSERLCVGIISHVEELKNRVPIKLIVTPATLGGKGTKVKTEIS